MPKGMVYLVGAGPGAPDLITLRGLEAIRRADVIIYDRLISPALLRHARPGAALLYAGKAPGSHLVTQEQINRMLVRLARQGQIVCRLKGGDPFVFGRGGEEALALAAAGIPFEVVPGVTSAVAVPAAAGIPVTHRGLSSGVTILTGHAEAALDSLSGIDWEAAARVGGTLVILMGVGHLAEIAERLIAAGRPPETPAALVEQGTLPQQRVITGTLATIAAEAERAGARPPAVIVVGEVVALAQQLGQPVACAPAPPNSAALGAEGGR
ncbi:MAG TPA: uroporphyrinogen-III C-methyltransferase [Symbiobacteriaceae bacterium]